MFAAERHKDQKIKDKNVSYIVHLSLVAMELINLFATVKGFDEDYAIQTALLHDVIEDTDAQYSDVEKHFGGEIADGVLALTKDYSLPKEAQMKDSVARILKQPREISLVKMSDRISNLNPPPVSWIKRKLKIITKRRYSYTTVCIGRTRLWLKDSGKKRRVIKDFYDKFDEIESLKYINYNNKKRGIL